MRLNKRNGLSFLSLILLTALFFSIISCGASLPQTFTESRKLWNDVKSGDYDFTLERQCFCPEDWRGPVFIEVRNGAADSVTYVSDGSAVTEGKFDNVDTIEKLFDLLEDAYRGRGDFDQKADSIEVTYDPEMGYPVTLWIDVSQQMADEEQGYAVTEMTPR